MGDNAAKRYWEANIKLIIKVLVIWFVVSYLAGIVFVEALNGISLGGYKLGFWFAQQGSIYTFVILIFYYAKQVDKLEDAYKKGA
mgnify:CR=1 FL=1